MFERVQNRLALFPHQLLLQIGCGLGGILRGKRSTADLCNANLAAIRGRNADHDNQLRSCFPQRHAQKRSSGIVRKQSVNGRKPRGKLALECLRLRIRQRGTILPIQMKGTTEVANRGHFIRER